MNNNNKKKKPACLKRLNFCCGNDESDDCVETASNCVDL